MKTKILLLLVLTLTFVFNNEANAQKFSGLDKSPHDIAYYRVNRGAAPHVKVVYGRPQLKGRSVEKLAPYDKVWRTGANEATEITFYKDVTFGGKSIKAGTYTLFTIPGSKEWTIILSSLTDTWGAFSYKENSDVARVSAAVNKDAKALEAFSIAFKAVDKGTHMILGWGTIRVAVPIMM